MYRIIFYLVREIPQITVIGCVELALFETSEKLQ